VLSRARMASMQPHTPETCAVRTCHRQSHQLRAPSPGTIPPPPYHGLPDVSRRRGRRLQGCPPLECSVRSDELPMSMRMRMCVVM